MDKRTVRRDDIGGDQVVEAGAAPSDVEFIGGAQDMPGGSTTYVRATLESGDYAWIAEVPSPGEKGMLKTFTVE